MAISKIQDAGVSLTGAALPAGSITSSQLTGDAVPIGVGQTWQDVAASRAMGTTYTNSTGKPIFVIISPNASGSLVGTLEINGSNAGFIQFTPSGGGGGCSISFMVPDGSTYRMVNNSNFGIQFWWELR